MWLMLQQNEPEDFVVATGQSHSVEEFLDAAFSYVGLNFEDYLVIDKNLYRPSEVKILQGDATKARQKLRWSNTCSFDDLVKDMVDGDLDWYSTAQHQEKSSI
jgi:GDPmannose 4,6-dehydratase